DFHHARTTVAVRAIAFLVAEVRNLDPVLLGRLDDGFVGAANDRFAVEFELDRQRRDFLFANCSHSCTLTPTRSGNISLRTSWGSAPLVLGRKWMRPSSPSKVPRAAADPIYRFPSTSRPWRSRRDRACTDRKTRRQRTSSCCARLLSQCPCRTAR